MDLIPDGAHDAANEDPGSVVPNKMQKIAAANNPGEDAAVGWTGEEGGKFEQAVSKISNTIWPSENIFHLSRNLDSKLMFREMYAEYSH